jgi:hypothetical protein
MTVSADLDHNLSAIFPGSGGADRENGNSGFFGKVHGLGAMGGRKRSEVGDQMFGSYIISGIHLCNLWLKWLEAWIPCILCILSLNGSILESTNRFDHRLHRYEPDTETNQLGGARFVVTGLGVAPPSSARRSRVINQSRSGAGSSRYASISNRARRSVPLQGGESTFPSKPNLLPS